MALTKVTYSMIESAPANVRDYGAVGDGSADDTVAFEAALATQRAVYVPKGVYKINAEIRNRTIIYGDGSTVSVLKPYVPTKAALTYTFAAMSSPPPFSGWNYHTEIRNLGFEGTGTMTGVGFTFAQTNPANYVSNDEYANNVKFFGCWFKNLEKGIQFPFGNIGTEIYSCGFKENYYGIYSLNNKFGPIMHAGCKSMYGGEMSGNICAVYFDNSADGFGQVYFNSVIFELNNLVGYIRNTSNTEITPVTFTDCWMEANGTNHTYTTATIDLWTGTTVSSQTLSSAQPLYLYGKHFVVEGGFAAGINCARPDSQVTVRNCRVEATSGYGGQVFLAASNSWITFDACITEGGIGANTNPKLRRGRNFRSVITSAAAGAPSRTFFLAPGYNKSISPARGGSSNTFETAQAFSGTGSGLGTVQADGLRYANCNQFSFVFSNPSQIYSFGYNIPAPSYYVFMFDVKNTSASPDVLPYNWTNLAGVNLGTGTVPNDNVWYTVGGLAYVTDPVTIRLWFGSGATGSFVWRVSAVMLRAFDTEQQAIDFLNEPVYLAP